METEVANTSPQALCEQHKYHLAVIAYVRNFHKVYKEGVTFDMLCRLLAPYFPVDGDEAIDLPRTENIVVWVRCSPLFKEIFMEAMATFEIHGEACNIQRYIHSDERMNDIMLAQDSDMHKRPFKTKWQPMWLLPGSGIKNMDQALKEQRFKQ